MRERSLSIAILSLLLLFGVLIQAQTGTDPSPQCAVIGRGAEGLVGEIQCRESALSKTPSRSNQIPAMLFRLAQTYQTLGEGKAGEYYNKLVTEHCGEATYLCAEARKQLAALRAKSNVPRRIDTPYTSDPYSFAISPDGQKLVYVATAGGKTALWLHDLKSGKAQPIPGTESDGYAGPMGGAHPFWSPDSKQIGFFVEGKLKRIDAAGGVAQTLADAPYNYGGSWNRNGVIIFVRDNLNAVYRVAATGGGQPQRLTELSVATMSHRFPQFLPDGRHFLFYRADLVRPKLRRTSESPLAIGSLDSSEVKELSASVQAVQAARFAPSDQLLIVGQRALFAQRLDTLALELNGAPTIVADQVADFRAAATPGYAAVSLSQSGPVAYRTRDTVLAQLIWFDRHGDRLTRLGEPEESASVASPRFSPDGRTLAVVTIRSDGAYLRLIDAIGGATRSSFVVDIARFRWDTLVWSADGQSLFFAMTPPNAGGNTEIYRRPIDSTVLERFIANGGNESIPAGASSDGKYLLYTVGTGIARSNLLLARPLAGGADVRVSGTVTNGSGRFSPDGRWVAYEEAGLAANADQIRIQSFPPSTTVQTRIAFKGHNPEWKGDGSELYFVSPDNRLMAVPFNLSDGSAGVPTPLFALPEGSIYTPAPDGRRFLVNGPLEAAPPIYVVSDWTRSVASPTSNSPTLTAAPAENRGSRQQIAVLDQRGNSIASMSAPYSGAGGSLTLSPDGTRIATIHGGELSVTNISNNAITRVAVDAVQVPAWSRDGRFLAYISDRVAVPGIYVRASNGAEPERLIYVGEGTGKATKLWNWSTDGRFIGATMRDRLAALSVTGTPSTVSIVPATGKTGMRLSPRGDFVAYISNESGSNQIFIRSFDPSDPNGYTQRQITRNGAVGMIRWRANGEELYYLDPRGVVMAVPITNSPVLRVGEPTALFPAPPGFVVDVAVSDSIADVSADGQRFVFLVPTETNAR